MKKIVDLRKYAQEVNAMQDLPAATVELPPLAALAIISHIQLAMRHLKVTDSEFAKIAISVARQLQTLFTQYSETCKALELGWNPAEDILTPSGELDDNFCEDPCDKFLQNLGCRCTGYKVAEVVVGDEDIHPEILAAGAAMMQQVRRNIESEGFEILDV